MQIGTLNQRVRFEAPSTTEDAKYGPQPGPWTTVATVWANVQEVLPSRAEKAQGIRIEARPARIRIRYRTDITSAMRVVLVDRGSRVLKIVSGPAELGRKEGLEIMGEAYSTTGDGT